MLKRMAKEKFVRMIHMTQEENKIQGTESEVKAGEVVISTKPPNEKQSDEKVHIKRGRVDSLSIYEISESELTTIERGSTNSIYLNFAIFLLSIAISFFISLLTSDFKNKQIVMTVFIVLTVVGFIGGSFLLILWYKMKDEFKITMKKIKERMKE